MEQRSGQVGKKRDRACQVRESEAREQHKAWHYFYVKKKVHWDATLSLHQADLWV